MRETKAEIIAVHGWGFDSSCWATWKDILDNSYSIDFFERGYLGKSKRTPFFSSLQGPKIIFTHSFGLHLCPVSLFSETDLLVIFNGFVEFHPVAAQYRRRSKLVVRQMLNALEEQPEKVLHNFYKNTFHPMAYSRPQKPITDKKLLIKDLQNLDTQTFDIRVLKSVNKICILHGSKDAIVPYRKGRELHGLFPGRAKYLEVKDAGHALPFTHAHQCRQFVEPEIKNPIAP